MLVLPHHILLHELVGVLWWWRRLGDLRNQVRGARFGDAIDKHAYQRNLEKDEESDGEAVKHALAVMEPGALLCAGVVQAGEVGFEL